MDRNAVVSICGQLREAREGALRDAEAFDVIIHVVERLGSLLHGEVLGLGRYTEKIAITARKSALAEDIPKKWGDVHVPFSRLYELVRHARNDALHQGAFARRLTVHAIELSLVLEDALKNSVDDPTVGDFMVRNPTCAELWQPISFIRQQMLASSFSFLPVNCAEEWLLVSDLEIATYLGTDMSARKEKMAHTLAQALDRPAISLQLAKRCQVNTKLGEALKLLDGSQRPLLVFRSEGEQQAIVGILTPFDLL